MNKAKLQRYRALLTGRLTTLVEHTGETVHEMEGDPPALSDPNDRASVEEERNFELRLRDRDRQLISKIKEALERIEEGTFGVCVECGQPIDEKRLAARPVTTQCIDCKSESERREKRR